MIDYFLSISRSSAIMKKIAILLYCFVFSNVVHAEDGYQLWLRYYLIDNKVLLEQYRTAITGIHINGNSPTLLTAKEEIIDGLSRILGKKITQQKELTAGSLIIGTPASSNLIKSLPLPQLQKAGKEGFVINTLKSNGKHIIALAANTDAGVCPAGGGTTSPSWEDATPVTPTNTASKAAAKRCMFFT